MSPTMVGETADIQATRTKHHLSPWSPGLSFARADNVVSFSIVSDCPVNTQEIGLGSLSILEGSTTVIIRGPGIDFVNIYLYVSVCRHVHMRTGACGGQKRTSETLEVKLEAIVSCLTCVLESELRSSARAASFLTH